MIRLLLLRHAKSSWTAGAADDFDRPLNARGQRDAPKLGAFMAGNDTMPGRILCSSARRTRETLAGLLPHLAGDLEVCLTRRLYDADAAGYLEAIREFGMTAPTLLVVGHNPSVEELAEVLAPIGDAEGLRAMQTKYPTSGLAVVDFDVARWAEVGPGGGRLAAFHTPRTIGADD